MKFFDANTVIMKTVEYTVISLDDIPDSGYMVYYLTFNGHCIACGHGKKNRARVILDDLKAATKDHIKSMLVRIYHKHGGTGRWSRCIVPCGSKSEAASLEKIYQKRMGGNSTEIPASIYKRLTKELDKMSKMILDMALCSAFSGFRDLKKWREKRIIDDTTWNSIQERLGTW
jgi:hypothetical protein